MKITGKKDEIVISDVCYGEVWFAGGQSNMELEVQDAEGGKEELKKTDCPDIRYYNVIKTPVMDEDVIKREAEKCWQPCNRGGFKDMSAVAYFFAKKLFKHLQVPIGIIDCYQGGTSISCWLSEDNLMSIPEGVPYMREYEKIIAGMTEEEDDRIVAEYAERVAAYEQREEECKKKNPNITMEELRDKAGE